MVMKTTPWEKDWWG